VLVLDVPVEAGDGPHDLAAHLAHSLPRVVLFMVVPGPAVRKGFVAYLTEPGRFIRLSSAASVKVANPGSATFFSAPTAPPVARKLRRLPCKPEENS